MGLPAFSIAKLFLNFSFARHNTKMPFYTSLFCVILNIAISVSFFNLIGFIIIPIATTISAWAHTILLFFFLKKDDLFNFNKAFVDRFIRIMFSVSLMGVFFNYLINLFDSTLAYGESLKFFYLIIIVLLGLIFYLIIAIFIKAFKISDIKLKY
jgi:putative peptidoglycan lipid II flippase